MGLTTAILLHHGVYGCKRPLTYRRLNISSSADSDIHIANDMVIKDSRIDTALAELEAISLHNTVARHSAQIAALSIRIDAISNHFTIHDPYEIRISGLPSVSTDLSLRDMTERVFTAIGCPNYVNHTIDIREWLHKPASADAAGQPSSGGRNKRCIVVQFTSGIARDIVLKSVKKIERQTAESLFGVGGRGRIYINILYPRSVYQLRKKAISVARSLNYARPVVKNLVVCMRETRESPLIPVYSEDALAALPRRIGCTCNDCRRTLVNPE